MASACFNSELEQPHVELLANIMMHAYVLADTPTVDGPPFFELPTAGPWPAWPSTVGQPQPTVTELPAVVDPPTELSSADPRRDVPLASPPADMIYVLLAEPLDVPHGVLLAEPPVEPSDGPLSSGPPPGGPPLVAEQ
jgi:hypothetical protein